MTREMLLAARDNDWARARKLARKILRVGSFTERRTALTVLELSNA